jgi:DNA-binding XRE family transcriptional regulator
MAKRTPPTHPAARRQLEALGARLRAARLRREMTQGMLAERVGVHVQTILKLESGTPTTSLATMLRVLQVLGMAADIDAIAAEDAQGRLIQDSRLPKSVRPPRGDPSA